jgi:tetrahydromethanopterin S-methyltransferase subunit G
MSTYSLNDIGHGYHATSGCSQNVVHIDASDVVNLSGELTIGSTSISNNSLLTINGTSTSRIFTSINSTSSTEQLVISHNSDNVEINNANTSTTSEINFLSRVKFTSPDTKCVTASLNDNTKRLANTEFVQNELDDLRIGELNAKQNRITENTSNSNILDVELTNSNGSTLMIQQLYDKSYLDSSFADVDFEINSINTFLTTYTAQVDTSLSDVDSRLDTLDTSVNNIVIPTDFYSQSYIDGSFADVDFEINSINTFLTTYTAQVDTSLSDVDSRLDTLDTSVNNIVIPTDFYSQSYIDGSFADVDFEINSINTFLTTYTAQVDTRLDTLDTSVNNIVIPTDFYSQSYIDGSFADVDFEINSINTFLTTYTAQVDTRLDTLDTSVNNIVIPTDFYSQSYIDGSFADVDFEINSINTFLTTYTAQVDTRLDTLDTSVNNIVIPTDFYSQSYIDGSFADVDFEINSINTFLTTYTAQVDTRLDTLDTSVNNIVIPTDFYSQSYIDGSFADVDFEINSINTFLTTYTAQVDTRLDTLDTSVNNIVIPTDFYSQSYIDGSFADVDSRLDTIDTNVNNIIIPTDFYSQSYINTSLNLKANTTDVYDTGTIDNKILTVQMSANAANNSATTANSKADSALNQLSGASNVGPRLNTLESSMNLKANLTDIPTDFYSQSYIDGSFAEVDSRLDTIDTNVNNIIIPTDFYSQSYIDNSLNLKANISDIPTDFYSTSYIDGSLNSKQDTLVGNESVLTTNFHPLTPVDSSVISNSNNLITSGAVSSFGSNFFDRTYLTTELNAKQKRITENTSNSNILDVELTNSSGSTLITQQVYDKSYIDTSFNDTYFEINSINTFLQVYTPQVDASLADTYSKSYVDNNFQFQTSYARLKFKLGSGTEIAHNSQLIPPFPNSRTDIHDTSVYTTLNWTGSASSNGITIPSNGVYRILVQCQMTKDVPNSSNNNRTQFHVSFHVNQNISYPYASGYIRNFTDINSAGVNVDDIRTLSSGDVVGGRIRRGDNNAGVVHNIEGGYIYIIRLN